MKWIKNWLKASEDSLTHYHSITTYDAYENIMGKGEISNLTTLNLSSANAFTLVWAQILSFGKGLTHSHTMTSFDAPGKQAF